ncbi:ribonuclease catalytic domain-containing protein [Desulfovibrio sp. OttesenSCG-928-A18]|nr:ribonuclease catalytic domain-containing protein [Desulfovibrio sp. OttesenSCG-928-A18]
MSANKVRYPGPGCLVEFMQGNSPMQAIVLEEQSGRLRLYAANKREGNLPASRLLPWSGPALGPGLSKQRMDEALEEHKLLRASIAASISSMEVWELTQGEVARTSAQWLAGLVWASPTIDQEAALGHVLLSAKSHFRFSPPDFEIFTQELVEARLAEAEAARIRESFAVTGAQFFQKLWDIHSKKRQGLGPQDLPEEDLCQRLRAMLLERIADPDCANDSAIWKLLVKSLPDSAHLALNLAVAWKLVPEHHNYWLDRAGYERGEDWAEPFAAERAAVREAAGELVGRLEQDPTPYISVDPADAQDRDDAFFVEQCPDGAFNASVAVACPALVWPFESPLDKAVLRRASSIYLPEGDEHMLPEDAGRALFGLDQGLPRLALVLRMRLTPLGELLEADPQLRCVSIARNLDLEDSEATLLALADQSANPAKRPGAEALTLARLLQERRIAAGAVITERPDPAVVVTNTGAEARVRIEDGPSAALSHLVVGELMILASSALAAWAGERGIPLLYRTQDVALPREFAGIWTEAHDISRVVRALPPASLDVEPRRHAGLGVGAYATLTSPIRRYVDLVNQAQICSWLRKGAARLNHQDMRSLLPAVSARADAVMQIQRLRPRYWKLLFFRQQGDKQWWDAVVAEENEAFVTVALPWAQIMVRGKRRQFGDKLYAGMHIQVRLGKVNPLLNEIQVLETREP